MDEAEETDENNHLDDIDGGIGCVEIWEKLSDERKGE